MIRRYPDVMVGMGSAKDLGQTGPDDAGDALRKVSIKVCPCIFGCNHQSKKHLIQYCFVTFKGFHCQSHARCGQICIR
jgi:hypothetical protein